MPNEFVARNGIIALNNSIITGSFTVVTGSAVEFQVINTGVKIGNIVSDSHSVTGSLNISGSLNINGTSYTAATSGTSGTAGSSGTSGATGAAGSSGTSGSSGSAGTSGATGAAGSSGTSGATGAAGSSGTSGTGFSTITNTSDNRVLTSLGTANTANAEANLTFDGTTLNINGNTLITGTFNVAPTAGNVELQVQSTGVNIGNLKSDLHNIIGAILIPYTSSGMLILDDPTSGSVYNNSDNFTQPQIRLKGTDGQFYRTGISLLKNQEVHLVSLAESVLAAKTISTVPRALLSSTTWLQWSPTTNDSTSPDTTIRRVSAGVLQVTSSIIATSFTGSLLGTASFATSASWAPGGGGSAPTSVTFNRVTGSYTFVLSDAGKTIEVSGSTNTSHSLTIPASSSVDFADGTYIDVLLYGTGSILFVTGSGVTVRSANNWLRMGTRYGASTLVNISGNEWYLIGNLNA